MASRGHAGLRRPVAMTLDREVCIECGACDEFVPGLLEGPGRIAITQASLEAMAACPVGAIHWLEREDTHDHHHDA